MTVKLPIPIFDGHNDALLRMGEDGFSFLNRNTFGGLDLLRAREGGFAGGFFAVYVRDEGVVLPRDPEEAMKQIAATHPQHREPESLPTLDYARAEALAMMARLFRLQRDSAGQVKVVHSAAEIEAALQDAGFNGEDLEKMLFRNWIRVLRQTWGE